MKYSHVTKYNKPPLGVTPKKFWLEERLNELVAAINRYIAVGKFNKVEEWVKEAKEIKEQLSNL